MNFNSELQLWEPSQSTRCRYPLAFTLTAEEIGSKSVANLPLKEGLFVKPLSQTRAPVDAALSTGPAVRPCTVAVKLIQGSAIAVSQLAHPMRNTAAKPNAPAAWRTNNFDYTADNVESVCPASFGLHTQAASSPDSSS